MDEIERFIAEDMDAAGDITSKAVLRGERAIGLVISKGECIAAGLEEGAEVFGRMGVEAELLVPDGREVSRGTEVLRTTGDGASILGAERLALNIIMRMSGIATMTRRVVEACRTVNPRIKVAATRKTTPGFRRYEKRAVALGGGVPHRSGLYDMIIVKDNHLALCGGVETAIARLMEGRPAARVEIEVTKMEDALKAAGAEVDVIMLDNLASEEGERIANAVRAIAPRIEIEASGGITLENAPLYARWADIISLGALTHSYKAADFSLEVRRW
ncbi:MAG: carboxylating nicotinate-nucleotide diphosphorylase [Candidatus Thermoplasmatota archaeon]